MMYIIIKFSNKPKNIGTFKNFKQAKDYLKLLHKELNNSNIHAWFDSRDYSILITENVTYKIERE